MAIGTITVVEPAKAPGPMRADVVSFAGDSAYATGGSAFKAELLEALGITGYAPLAVISVDCGGYVPAYDSATGKLKVYAGDYSASADGPMAEVTAAVDLSGVTFKVCVLSH